LKLVLIKFGLIVGGGGGGGWRKVLNYIKKIVISQLI